MKKREMIVGLCIGLLVIGLSGNAFANNVVSEIGPNVIACPEALAAAKIHNSEQKQTNVVYSEIGPDAMASPEALAAAKIHNSEQKQTNVVYSEIGPDAMASPKALAAAKTQVCSEIGPLAAIGN